MKKRNIRRVSAFILVGIAAYWTTQPEGKFPVEPKASLRYSTPADMAWNRNSISEISPKYNKDLVKTSKISRVRFQSKTRRLLKLNAINELISKKLEIEALLLENPEYSKEVPNLILKKKGTLRSKKALINSLAEVETTESQKAIVSILNSSNFSEDLRIQAVVSSRELMEPRDSVINELWSLTQIKSDNPSEHNALATAALLALGSIASNPSDIRSEEIVEHLIRRLGQAETDGEIQALDFIDALGNSGNVRVIEIAERYILSPVSGERSLAAGILRKVKDSRANQMLLEILDSDEAPEVRKEAIQTLSYRKLEASEFVRLSELMLEEPDSAVRQGMIAQLKDKIDREESVRASMEKLLEIETDGSNSRQISEALARAS